MDSYPYPYQLTDAKWRKKLTHEEFYVLRRGGTEAYGKGEFCKYFPKEVCVRRLVFCVCLGVCYYYL